MPVLLSLAQVQALAPDASAVAAGRKLGSRAPWKGLGQSDRALWGECQGSALYRTEVALADMASKCSCPSRKFPCKHALGILFLAAQTPDAFPQAPEPDWVVEWLDKRGAAQQRKQARAEAGDKPVDEAQQLKRAEKRGDNILAGIEQLEMWMSDLLRRGLARVQSEPPSFWDTQARRLVDAQAPGLAGRVRWMGAKVGAFDGWTDRVLDDLGMLGLLTHAFRRIDQLGPALAADVRRLVGITLDQAEVIAQGESVEDEWTVLADVIDEDERLRVQRAWLKGAASARTALVLQFSVNAGRFAEVLTTGTRFRGKLAFWPSACPQRALIASRAGQASHVTTPPTGTDAHAALERFAEHLAVLPWFDRDLFVLEHVTTEPGALARLVDRLERAVPLAGRDHDRLVAVGGGHPITVAGEWDGYAFVPLTAWSDGRVVSVARSQS